MNYSSGSVLLLIGYFFVFVYFKGDLERVWFTTGRCEVTRNEKVFSVFNHSTPVCGFFPTMDACIAGHLQLENLILVSIGAPVSFYGLEEGCHVQGRMAMCSGFSCPYTVPFSSCLPKNFTIGFCSRPWSLMGISFFDSFFVTIYFLWDRLSKRTPWVWTYEITWGILLSVMPCFYVDMKSPFSCCRDELMSMTRCLSRSWTRTKTSWISCYGTVLRSMACVPMERRLLRTQRPFICV